MPPRKKTMPSIYGMPNPIYVGTCYMGEEASVSMKKDIIYHEEPISFLYGDVSTLVGCEKGVDVFFNNGMPPATIKDKHEVLTRGWATWQQFLIEAAMEKQNSNPS